MAGSHKPVEVDQEAVKRSHEMWEGFVSYSKVSIVFIAVTLALMAAFLL